MLGSQKTHASARRAQDCGSLPGILRVLRYRRHPGSGRVADGGIHDRDRIPVVSDRVDHHAGGTAPIACSRGYAAGNTLLSGPRTARPLASAVAAGPIVLSARAPISVLDSRDPAVGTPAIGCL